eukprot:CAMPEP_0198305384 /NCGR_PEP_ID=MMETSP1449-20131203/57879_1 /TAXON_ID=420275 /ORGANISM="Attheya septentrionalis, Strain CCMP2084" /LENGTH=411 /DNA_ID=CAMNT_0044007917 /DNA_START=264 /DNA_END=1499 /DNA_ORIENTATION=-
MKSGFSKGSVAGALTFFPPDPPLYGFQRLNKDGEILPEEAEEAEEEKTSEEDDEGDLEFDDEDEDETDENFGENGQGPDDGSLIELPQSKAKKVDKKKKDKKKKDKKKKEKKASPSQQLTERARILRQRAKVRNRRDARDAEAGVTYNFAPDPRLACPSLSARVTAEAVKVGPQKKTGTHIAALIYRYQPRNPSSSNKDHPVKTILYSHGNATDIGAMNMMQSVMCRAIGCNVVMYDYSGYGESGGIPLESNTYRDIKLMYKYVVDHVANGVEANVVVYGQSVGSGPSCYIASKEPDIGGLILHSPFTSGMRVLTPSRALACLDIFPNIDRIKKVQCPVMVIHGEQDEEVSVDHGLALHQAVPEELQRDPWWVRGRGHNDITDGPQKMTEYIRRLRTFLDSLDETTQKTDG